MVLALHRIRFAVDADTEIDLEWTKGKRGPQASVSIPRVSVAEVELEPDEQSNQVPPIAWRADSPALFAPLQLREDTEYFLDITLPFSMSDAQKLAEETPGWPFNHRLANVFKHDPPHRWKTTPKGTTITGILRLGSNAGLLNLSLNSAEPVFVEVVCRKLSYMEEFKSLLDELAAESTELLLDIESPVSSSFKLTDLTPETEAALLFQLRNILAEPNLPTALAEIRRAFHSRLQASRAVRDIAEIEDFDLGTFVEEFDPGAMSPGGPLRDLFRGHTVHAAPAIDIVDTADTQENRYVKFFLEDLRQLAQQLAVALRGRTSSEREVADWIDIIDEELSNGHWKSVGPFRVFPSNSQVLAKREGYRDILRFDLSLRMSLSLPWKRSLEFADGLVGDIRPVNELYEYWCFFHLRRILRTVCVEHLQPGASLIESVAGGFQLKLLRGRRSKSEFVYRREEKKTLFVTLYYNRQFKRPTRPFSAWYGSYTARFDPDYSVEVRLEDAGRIVRHWLHFDAKYRVDFRDLEELFAPSDVEEAEDGRTSGDYETELQRFHRRDDLYKMHTYRDGILGSRGAYIIFPGTAEESQVYVRHPSAVSGEPAFLFPGVGAFSLCPGRAHTQRTSLQAFFSHVLSAIYDNKPYKEEEGFFAD